MQISFTKRKIQYLYLGLTIVSILLGLVSYARAQETTTSPAVDGRTAASEARETRRAALTQDMQDRFINLIRNAYGRMDAAITRLENIATRLEERIALLEEDGVDTSLALQPLNDAKNKLEEAKSALAQAKANAENSIVSDTPRERFTVARQQFVNIRQAIRDAYILLRESVAELKDAVTEADLNGGGVSDAVQNSEPVTEEATN
jgi:hypothetical protein